MKLMRLLAVAMSFQMGLMAQGKTSMDSEKQGVAIVPFDYVALSKSYGATETVTSTGRSVQWKSGSSDVFSDADQVKAFADAATEKVTNAFVKLKRFKVLSRKDVEKLTMEQNFQMSDNVNMESAVQIGNMLGAAYMVMGQMQNVSATEIKDAKGKSTNSYQAKVEMQLRIVDVSTGQILASKDFKGDKGEGSAVVGAAMGLLMKGGGGAAAAVMGSSTPSNAAFSALNEAEKKIYEWATAAFPVEGDIFEIVKESKKDLIVSITCGKDLGVKKDDRFKVYEVKDVEINGKVIHKTTDVGFLVVKKTEEDGVFSTCEADGGNKAISDKVKAGVKLKVVQVKKK